MGINTPSLYAAFGNKEALFVRALDHYVRLPGGCFVAETTSEAGGDRLPAGASEGLAVMARKGAKREDLDAVIECAVAP